MTATTAPRFAFRRSLTAAELQRVDDLCVIMEHTDLDSDHVPFWVYTVGGSLDGVPLFEGCTVGGDAIVISGVANREEADHVATSGLMDTVSALDESLRQYLVGRAALVRLETVGELDRLDLATRKPADKSDAFELDSRLIEPLKGEDILLAAGGVTRQDEARH